MFNGSHNNNSLSPVRRIDDLGDGKGLQQCEACSKGCVDVGHYGYFYYLWECDLVQLFWRAEWLYISKP